jgi:hypothetical protein
MSKPRIMLRFSPCPRPIPPVFPKQVFDALRVLADVRVGIAQDHGNALPAAKLLKRREVSVCLIVPCCPRVAATVRGEIHDASAATCSLERGLDTGARRMIVIVAGFGFVVRHALMGEKDWPFTMLEPGQLKDHAGMQRNTARFRSCSRYCAGPAGNPGRHLTLRPNPVCLAA